MQYLLSYEYTNYGGHWRFPLIITDMQYLTKNYLAIKNTRDILKAQRRNYSKSVSKDSNHKKISC